MPYITHWDRTPLDANLVHVRPCDPGELNYCITYLIVQYLGKFVKYHNYNEVMGVLECAKHELYRRMIAEYEDCKKRENGEVYPNLHGVERNEN